MIFAWGGVQNLWRRARCAAGATAAALINIKRPHEIWTAARARSNDWLGKSILLPRNPVRGARVNLWRRPCREGAAPHSGRRACTQNGGARLRHRRRLRHCRHCRRTDARARRELLIKSESARTLSFKFQITAKRCRRFALEDERLTGRLWCAPPIDL